MSILNLTQHKWLKDEGMKGIKHLVIFIFLFIPCILSAQPVSILQQDVLAHFKGELMTGVNQSKMDRLSNNFLPTALIVLENGQAFHSMTQLNEFMKSPNNTEGVKIKKFTIEKVNFDKDVTIVDESTFIATGTALFQYQLVRGKVINVPVRWSATITQVIDKWKIAGLQNTVNVLENPVIDEMQNDFYMMCFIAFIIGLIIGYSWKKIVRKKL
ncbi:MAG: hypothetical protein HYX61_02015 [Gammaproteobacteria bacterium]|jgi:hypothetical protein|nr:hypothetical protein [Gammaproteobacteria bacterium]